MHDAPSGVRARLARATAEARSRRRRSSRAGVTERGIGGGSHGGELERQRSRAPRRPRGSRTTLGNASRRPRDARSARRKSSRDLALARAARQRSPAPRSPARQRRCGSQLPTSLPQRRGGCARRRPGWSFPCSPPSQLGPARLHPVPPSCTRRNRLALVGIAAGCGGDDEGEDPTAAWASGFCSAITDWTDELQNVSSQFSDTSNLSEEGLQSAAEDVRTATQTLVDDLEDLGGQRRRPARGGEPR